MDKVSFKERVKNEIISCAKIYNNVFIKHDYLVCSPAFKDKNFYIISACKDNYKHLTGVNSSLNAELFFEKCLDGSISENDFSFEKHGRSKKDVKGNVRHKIQVLHGIGDIFSVNAEVEENFCKNRICCSFAAADSLLTLGFTETFQAKPKTLLKGYLLSNGKSDNIELLLRKGKNEERFNEIIIGDNSTLTKYFDSIHDYLDNHLLAAVKKDTLVENIDDDILDLTGGFSNLRR